MSSRADSCAAFSFMLFKWDARIKEMEEELGEVRKTLKKRMILSFLGCSLTTITISYPTKKLEAGDSFTLSLGLGLASPFLAGHFDRKKM